MQKKTLLTVALVFTLSAGLAHAESALSGSSNHTEKEPIRHHAAMLSPQRGNISEHHSPIQSRDAMHRTAKVTRENTRETVKAAHETAKAAREHAREITKSAHETAKAAREHAREITKSTHETAKAAREHAREITKATHEHGREASREMAHHSDSTLSKSFNHQREDGDNNRNTSMISRQFAHAPIHHSTSPYRQTTHAAAQTTDSSTASSTTSNASATQPQNGLRAGIQNDRIKTGNTSSTINGDSNARTTGSSENKVQTSITGNGLIKNNSHNGTNAASLPMGGVVKGHIANDGANTGNSASTVDRDTHNQVNAGALAIQ